jgi:dihydroorotate dehydrogenase electron transfer subunit
MKQVNAKILSNSRIKAGYYKLILDTREIKETFKAGQFVNVRVDEGMKSLLRKPFSVFSASKKPPRLGIFYRVVGKGTKILSRKVKGEKLDIIGPLGNGYKLPEKNTPVILIGGGTGLASLAFLAETLVKEGFKDIMVLLGFKDRANMVCYNEFKQMGCPVGLATEDGCKGFKGCVPDLLESVLKDADPSTVVYACGPKGMLRKTAVITKKYFLKFYVSLEEYMACGVGACMGCVVKTRPHKAQANNKFVYKTVCKDGPVFDAMELVWE